MSTQSHGEVEVPPRANYAGDDFEAVPEAARERDLPDHLIEVMHPNHTAVCEVCEYWITVGPKGTEYGHARASNRGPGSAPRVGCPHRPESVNPAGRGQ